MSHVIYVSYDLGDRVYLDAMLMCRLETLDWLVNMAHH